MSKKTLLLVQSLQSEIDRLTRELAEAKARAGSAFASLPDEPPADLLLDIARAIQYPSVYAEGAHPAMLETAKRVYAVLLSARPDPKESSNVE